MASNPHENHVATSNPLRWFPEFWELSHKRLRPQARVLGLSLVVGVIAGLGAILFFVACQVVFYFALDVVVGYQPFTPGGEPPMFGESMHEYKARLIREGVPEDERNAMLADYKDAHPFRPWLLLLVPTIGGILSGFLVYTIAPEAEGHGTDAAIAAYHRHQGNIRPRVPLVKIFASALTIGSGGSGGREGPIAQIGAGFGSFLGRLLRLRPAERRVLMAAGMGAGVAAIFRAPLAGALFASEVLYRSPEFEAEVVMPAGLASVTAYCTFGLAFGWQPLFSLTPEVRDALVVSPLQLVPLTVVAVFMAVLAMIYTRSFYGLTDLFRRIPIRPHFKPAIGAFLSAVVGLAIYYAVGQDVRALSVLSFGYGSLQQALTSTDKDLAFALVLAAVAVGKILTTGLTIGSGGSGGVFGPSMVIGGCGGGALGLLALAWLPSSMTPSPATYVIVGMAGFFAAAAKTPVSTLVIVSEMTGGYSLLMPTLWVCAVSFLLSDEQSIYSSQVENRSLSPAHQGDFVRQVLAGIFVGRFVTSQKEVPTVRPEDRLDDVIERLSNSPYQALPVTDGQASYLGVVSLEEVHLASQSPNLIPLIVAADLMRTDVTPLSPDDRLDRALELFTESDLLSLPVVDSSPERRVIGIVKRSDVSSTYLRCIHGTTALAKDGVTTEGT